MPTIISFCLHIIIGIFFCVIMGFMAFAVLSKNKHIGIRCFQVLGCGISFITTLFLLFVQAEFDYLASLSKNKELITQSVDQCYKFQEQYSETTLNFKVEKYSNIIFSRFESLAEITKEMKILRTSYPEITVLNLQTNEKEILKFNETVIKLLKNSQVAICPKSGLNI